MHNTPLLSTAYLPPVSWMKEAVKAQKVFIEAHETYSKQTYRNRCRIITANGIIPLSIPVKKLQGKHSKTRDIEISYDEPWQMMHWRTIDAAYSNSPFYLYYKDDLQVFFNRRFRFLLDYNMEITYTIFRLLGITAELYLTKEYSHQPDDIKDLRNALTPKTPADISLFTPYPQVFEERHGFIHDLSVIDLLFNEGPAALSVLNRE